MVATGFCAYQQFSSVNAVVAIGVDTEEELHVEEMLLHQVAERGRAESNFTVGDANDLQDLKTQAAGSKKVFPRVVHRDSLC